MTLTQILPTVQQLPKLDKIRLIRILAQDLDTKKENFPFEPHKIYYLQTPYNVYGAGKMLIDALKNDDTSSK